MGVARDDDEGRHALLLKNFEFFGAPHACFLSMPETMHRANAIDLGIFLQTLMLLFAERGISCCPQGALAAYPGPVKRIAGVPEENAIMCGASFGYADPEATINEVTMPREPLESVATFSE
jgi:nitroreductase